MAGKKAPLMKAKGTLNKEAIQAAVQEARSSPNDAASGAHAEEGRDILAMLSSGDSSDDSVIGELKL